MNKIFLTVLSLTILVGILAGYMLLFRSDVNRQDSATNKTSEIVDVIDPVETEPIVGKGSLESLLSLAKNLECKIKYNTEGNDVAVEGSYFTAKNMLRGDFLVPGITEPTISSMILRDQTMYTWTVLEGETYGMKINLDTLKTNALSDTSPETREPVPLEAEVDYECKPWIGVDASIFEPPTNIMFKDYNEIMGTGMEFGTIYEEAPITDLDQCALCNQVPAGPGQTECKARFACE